MQAMVLFGVVLVLMGAAFAIPVGALRQRSVRDDDAPVLGASVLTLGLGALNFLAVIWSLATGGDAGILIVPFALAPLVAGWLGMSVVRGRTAGGKRSVLIVAAALLTLAGLPGYFAPNVALMVAVVGAGAFIAGLIRNPRALFKGLDPRL